MIKILKNTYRKLSIYERWRELKETKLISAFWCSGVAIWRLFISFVHLFSGHHPRPIPLHSLLFNYTQRSGTEYIFLPYFTRCPCCCEVLASLLLGLDDIWTGNKMMHRTMICHRDYCRVCFHSLLPRFERTSFSTKY